MTTRLTGGVTPTMLRVLRSCGLRLAFAMSGRGRAPSTPAARLGTAAHEVLALVARGELPGSATSGFDAAVEVAWATAIEHQRAESVGHDAEAAFGPPAAWPSFNDIASRVLAEARVLAVERQSWPGRVLMVEETIRRAGQVVWGTPDLVVGEGQNDEAFVADHKTGIVTDADMAPGGDVRAQLLVYAHLARLAGIEVAYAEARPVARARRRLDVDWAQVDAVLDEAGDLAKAFNRLLAAGKALDLGRPSEENCGRCPYAAECPAAWAHATPAAFGALQFVTGTVVKIEDNGRGNVLVELNATAGTLAPGRVTVTRLPVRRLPLLRHMSVGEHLRVAGLAGEPGSRLLRADRGTWPRLSSGPLRPPPGGPDAVSS